MQTPQEVKNWYLNDSYNTKIKTNGGENIGTNYRFGCVISQNIIDALLLNQGSKQIYLGSNLSVLEEISGNIKYELFYYTYTYDAPSKNYLFGRVLYDIIDFTIDYKSYLKSCDNIILNITLDNLILTKSKFTQAYKQDSNIGAIRLDVDKETNTYFSLMDIYTKDMRKRYGVTSFMDNNFFNNTPIYIYNYISRTPSTCKFANELVKQLKTSISNKSTYESNNIPI